MKLLPVNISARLSLGIFAVAFGLLCLHTRRYLPFIADDALISLRYAKRFAHGLGLTWNDGERVEGYSNLLWVLSSAVLGWAGIDFIAAVRLLGFVAMGATLAAILYAHPPRTMKAALPFLLALLFVPLSGPMAVWTIGGMEQPLVAALLAWAVVLCYPHLEKRDSSFRQMLGPGFLFALLCWTRLDGPVFVAAAAGAILVIDGFSRHGLRKALALAFLPLLFCLLQVIFRSIYYGEWIPNTALVKFAPSGKHALDGWGYLRVGAVAIAPLLVLATASAALSARKKFMRARVIFLLALVSAWAIYLIVIGGDFFPAWRHFVPLMVLLVLTVAIGAEWIATHAARRIYMGATTAAALLLSLFVFLQFRDEENFRAVSERWEWDGQVIGTLLKKAFQNEQPLVAVDPAGCLPYWSELPSLDMLGLNDYYLPRHPPPDLGKGPIGHELGDGRYVLDRKPDLVIFLLPTGNDRGYFLSGRQMQEDPRFFRDYKLVWFEGREPYTIRSRIWARKDSEKIGIRRDPNGTCIPGFLFSDNPGTITYLDSSGRLVILVRHDLPARVNEVELGPGRWRIEAEASQPALNMKISTAAGGEVIFDARNPGVFDLSGALPNHIVNIELTPGGADAVEVREVKLTRMPPEN
jgi:arabinofuranosyltransferase